MMSVLAYYTQEYSKHTLKYIFKGKVYFMCVKRKITFIFYNIRNFNTNILHYSEYNKCFVNNKSKGNKRKIHKKNTLTNK